jgi:hypothetical protein
MASFTERVIRAARLDAALYEEVEADATGQAMASWCYPRSRPGWALRQAWVRRMAIVPFRQGRDRVVGTAPAWRRGRSQTWRTAPHLG